MTTQLPFQYFDCDNHYYEALDAFTRHIEPNTESGRSNGRNWTANNACWSAAESTGSFRIRRSTRWESPARSTSTSAAETPKVRT